jgi:hypothetical protein
MHDIRSYLDSELNRRSKDWKKLKNALVPALPPEFMEKIVYAVLEDQTLTIFCDSPAWTSKLRFYDAEVSKTFRGQGLILKKVIARTVPPIEMPGSLNTRPD